MPIRLPEPTFRPAAWHAVVLAAIVVGACGRVEHVQATDCDPLADTGCPEGEHCRLGAEGERLCLALEAAPPDVACTPGSCSPGETCAQVEGFLACRPLCVVEDGTCPGDAACTHALDETYGVCVARCDPFPAAGRPDDCPGGTCAPVPDVAYPICVALGPARAGDECRSVRCGRALTCLAADDGIRCRSLCRTGEDALCPAPLVCAGEVADRGLGYCRAPAEPASE